MATERAADEVIERVLTTALTRHPDAPIAAVLPDGWFTELPASLSAGRIEASAGETPLELCVPADRPKIVAAWARARATGAAAVYVHLLDAPDDELVMQFLDVRHLHGTFMMLLLPEADDLADPDHGESAALPPRYCRIHRDELAHIVWADEASERMFGWEAGSLQGRKSIDFIHPDDHERAIDNWLEMLSRPGQSSRWRGRYLMADGGWKWVEITNHNRLGEAEQGDVLTEIVDVADEMAMHESLRAREELFRELTQALPVGVLQFDGDHRIEFTNERVREILGHNIRTLDDWTRCIDADDRGPFAQALDDVLDAGEARDLELRLTLEGGARHLVCDVNLRRLLARGETGLLLCVADVTDRAALRDELVVRATYDALTGCHNRSSTLRQLGSLLRAPGGSGAGVVFIDLDGFKPINDHLGHATGDEILAIVADRLRSSTRSGDVIGRIGGDEFVVLSPGTRTQDELDQLTGRLQAALDMSARVGAVDVEVRASIGATIGRVGDVADLVLASADAAMYASKRTKYADAEPDRSR